MDPICEPFNFFRLRFSDAGSSGIGLGALKVLAILVQRHADEVVHATRNVVPVSLVETNRALQWLGRVQRDVSTSPLPALHFCPFEKLLGDAMAVPSEIDGHAS